MRFEPRLIRQDDPDDSPELPDDLAELGAQLSVDADYLSARYPAGADSALPSAASSDWPSTSGVDWGRRFLRGTAAAIVLCSIGLLGGRLWRGDIARPQSVGAAALVRIPDAQADRDRHTGELPASEVVSLSGGKLRIALDQPAEQSPVALGSATRSSTRPQFERGILEHDQIDFDRHVGEVGFSSSAPVARVDIPGDELGMLKIQLDAFEKVIVKLQAELKRRQAQQNETDELVESLRREVESLRKLQSEKPARGDKD